MYRRTTGPIRRAKGGWTAEEVSRCLLETIVSASLLAKLIKLEIQLIWICYLCPSQHCLHNLIIALMIFPTCYRMRH